MESKNDAALNGLISARKLTKWGEGEGKGEGGQRNGKGELKRELEHGIYLM